VGTAIRRTRGRRTATPSRKDRSAEKKVLSRRTFDAATPLAASADSEDKRRLSFWAHFDELRSRLKIIFVTFIILFAVFMTFSVAPVRIGSTQVPLLVPAFAADQAPVGGQLFSALLNYLVPKTVSGHVVNVTAHSVVDGVVVEIKTAMFLAVLVDSPIIVYELWLFIGPALKPSEKRLILRMTVPVLLLFLTGVLLCLFLVLPFTYRLLFSYQGAIGVTFYQLYVDDFANFTLLFLLAFGLAFQLPVVMYALSSVGIVGANFWKRYWRFAVAGIFIIGALITPDASGITMMFVSLPMLALYAVGYYTSSRAERRRTRSKSS
jgi:sec-independent protein translocase protein TatC